ncbi:MAG: hypothetical protein ACREMQ_13480 [Longimicrobiales bacterium]
MLRGLATRGHEVHLVREPFGSRWPPFVLALADGCPGIRLHTMPAMKQDEWWEVATHFRRARFYLRFFGPAYRKTPGLLARARKWAPGWTVWLAETFGPAGRWLLVRLLDLLEQSTRTAAHLHQYLRERKPDLVVVTPLVLFKTKNAQLDLARAAIELGIRNVFAVASWDHLSSKGVLSFSPQQVLMWNDVQKREAIELHGLDAERIVVTGAQVFDDWFDKKPSSTRKAFCARVGLRADRPFLLYVCSSLLEASPEEPAFILRWVRHLRQSGHSILRDCGIVIRRHPERDEGWDHVDVAGLDNVVCWPPLGDAPVDERSKTDYFDSMYHAAAVIGLNTSAMIEAAIVGRPVHTVLLPEFWDNQEGTLHFHYLLEGEHALLRATRSLDDHARDLAGVLEGRDRDPGRSARFVRAFVRPCGIDIRSATCVIEALEAVGSQPAPAPVPVLFRVRLLRPLILPLLQPYAHTVAKQIRLAQEELRRQGEQRLLEHRRSKEPMLLEHRRRRMEEHRRRKQEAAQATGGAVDRIT